MGGQPNTRRSRVSCQPAACLSKVVCPARQGYSPEISNDCLPALLDLHPFAANDLRSAAAKHAHRFEFSDETERLMDHAIRGLVGLAFDKAVEVLTRHRSVHEKTAELLLQKETLEQDDIAALRTQILPAEGVAGDAGELVG